MSGGLRAIDAKELPRRSMFRPIAVGGHIKSSSSSRSAKPSFTTKETQDCKTSSSNASRDPGFVGGGTAATNILPITFPKTPVPKAWRNKSKMTMEEKQKEEVDKKSKPPGFQPEGNHDSLTTAQSLLVSRAQENSAPWSCKRCSFLNAHGSRSCTECQQTWVCENTGYCFPEECVRCDCCRIASINPIYAAYGEAQTNAAAAAFAATATPAAPPPSRNLETTVAAVERLKRQRDLNDDNENESEDEDEPSCEEDQETDSSIVLEITKKGYRYFKGQDSKLRLQLLRAMTLTEENYYSSTNYYSTNNKWTERVKQWISLDEKLMNMYTGRNSQKKGQGLDFWQSKLHSAMRVSFLEPFPPLMWIIVQFLGNYGGQPPGR